MRAALPVRCAMSCHAVAGSWLAVCGRIVPGVNRICAGSLAIVFRFADEIGGIVFAVYYRNR
jgi:hypothetical protein